MNHSTQGAATVNAITIWRCSPATSAAPGAAPFSITGPCNAMGTREAGFTSSLPGYRKFENAADRAELAGFGGCRTNRDSLLSAGWLIRTSSKAPSPKRFARSGSSPPIRWSPSPIRTCCSRTFESRFSGGAGWLSSDADHRIGAPGAAGRDLGRKRRHVHELRAPREQGEQSGRAAGRGPLRFRYLSRRRAKSSAAVKSSIPVGPRPRTPSTNGGECPPGGCAITPASVTSFLDEHGGVQWPLS